MSHADHHPENTDASDHQKTPTPTMERYTDVAIVGGSAAGLATALQLSRLRRSVVVIDSGQPRNAPATSMHSYLGHEGRSPVDFLRIARDEVRSYGTEVLMGAATDVTRDDDGFHIAVSGGHLIHARRVVAASGAVDVLPDIPGLAEHWGRAVIHCPFCHGYEARDQRIVSLITSPVGLHSLPLLYNLTDRLTVVLHSGVDASDPQLEGARQAGVTVIAQPVERVVNTGDGPLRGLVLADGSEVAADTVLVGTTLQARVDAFASLGLTAVEHPAGVATMVHADPMTGATEVPGVYAVGTITEPMLQVLPTAAAGTRVGGMIGFDLAREDMAAAARPSAPEADWDGRYSGEKMWSGNPNGSLVAQATDLTPGTAIDIGAGEGGDAIWLAEQGWKVTASDISQRALDRLQRAADERGTALRTHRADANAADPFNGETYDLVTAAYASLPRTPDGRGLANLLDAVAPGGHLVIVNHDTQAMDEALASLDPFEATRIFDHHAFIQTDDIATAIDQRDGWTVKVNEVRERPAGAASGHHVLDVVLHAHRAN
ncbi:bifunctional NAD(P)/FAD-dependent oxidoreductase/class I SAM-dependent methyltransferase [Demetria terragena]|uniref:bifunctional NAD(P)/FAD-dependent oxidoreductase/class I SAM-dependent methyltransferase n=1 Tax=Demetria terragena TaxID=63959 RepID=UPI000477EE1D|nr:bifunctional NAD(P)/FAD-dependent oxidoreductase/class I SAM-dependent methyltransferase [Demetria terragena]